MELATWVGKLSGATVIPVANPIDGIMYMKCRIMSYTLMSKQIKYKKQPYINPNLP